VIDVLRIYTWAEDAKTARAVRRLHCPEEKAQIFGGVLVTGWSHIV
jgi:hypothetical protein